MSKTFCPIPWIFQAVRNNGDVRVCCQANVSKNRGIIRDKEGRPYNASEGRLTESRNAELVREMRLQMLEGEWPSECVRCQQEEESGLNSRRQYELSNWNTDFNEMKKITSSDGSIPVDKAPVIYYDLRFGNKCNLSCRMCGPSDSDQWYNDYVQLTGRNYYHDSHGKVELEKVKDSWKDTKNSYSWYTSPLFWEELEKNQNNIQHIYMAGGEPLLIDQHYEFLEKCIEQNLGQNIVLEYNTNLTLLPQRVVKLWSQFKQVRVGASIDGFGDNFEFQRYPARWDMVYKNLQKLDQLERPVLSWLAYTVTAYNVMHLPEFMYWKVKESGFQKINSTKKRPVITHHMAHKPEHLNVRVLSSEQKQKVTDHFMKFKSIFESEFDELHSKKAIEILNSVEKYMHSQSYYESHYDQLISFSERMDQIRNENSQNFLP